MKHKLYKSYMECALAFSKQSRAVRKKVGAVAVTPQDVMIYSWNGTASGDDNACEIMLENGELVTKDEVLHAESNVVAKAAREGVSLKGSTVFITLSPCMACSKMLFQAGVERVVYLEEYRDRSGIDYLKKHCIIVEKMEKT